MCERKMAILEKRVLDQSSSIGMGGGGGGSLNMPTIPMPISVSATSSIDGGISSGMVSGE